MTPINIARPYVESLKIPKSKIELNMINKPATGFIEFNRVAAITRKAIAEKTALSVLKSFMADKPFYLR
jgi:hypothetical protein